MSAHRPYSPCLTTRRSPGHSWPCPSLTWLYTSASHFSCLCCGPDILCPGCGAQSLRGSNENKDGTDLIKAKFTVTRTEWGSCTQVPKAAEDLWPHLDDTGQPQCGTLGRRPRLLTHGFQLPDELLFRPFGPLLLVGIDGAEDGATGLATVLDGWDIQIVHQDDVRVLQGGHRDGQHEGGMEPSKVTPAGADWLTVPTPGFLNLGTTDSGNQLILCCGAVLGTVECPHPLDAIKPCPCPSVTTRNVSKHCPLSAGGQNHPVENDMGCSVCN